MDRGAWQTTVSGAGIPQDVTELQLREQTTKPQKLKRVKVKAVFWKITPQISSSNQKMQSHDDCQLS